MAKPEFTVNATRYDPYKNMKFKIKWDGKYVAGVSKISALKRSTEPVVHRNGGDPNAAHVSPSIWKFEPITLERGVTHDPEFEHWANLIYSVNGAAPGISLENFRKSLTIELLNEQAVVVKSYQVFNCWVSEYQALPELDANAHAIAIEHMVIQNEGWERDPVVREPKQT